MQSINTTSIDTGYQPTSSLLIRYIPATVVGSLICLFALIGNSSVIAIYMKHRGSRDNTMKFVLNLALTDCATGLACAIFIMLYAIEGNHGSFIECVLPYQVLYYLSTVSQTLVVVITFERYLAICDFQRYSKIVSEKAMDIAIFASWVFPIPLSMLPMYGYNNWDNIRYCIFPLMLKNWHYISISSSIIVLMLVTVVIYSRILLKAREFYRRVRPGQQPGSSAEQRTEQRITGRSIRNAKLIGILTMVFTVCWLPYNILLLMFGIGYRKFSSSILSFLFMVGLSNCIMNPFIYAWQRVQFRKDMKNFLLCKKGEPEGRLRVVQNSIELRIGRDKIQGKSARPVTITPPKNHQMVSSFTTVCQKKRISINAVNLSSNIPEEDLASTSQVFSTPVQKFSDAPTENVN